MGTLPNSRPSMRMWAHLRSSSHGTWSEGPMWMFWGPIPRRSWEVTDWVLEIFLEVRR